MPDPGVDVRARPAGAHGGRGRARRRPRRRRVRRHLLAGWGRGRVRRGRIGRQLGAGRRGVRDPREERLEVRVREQDFPVHSFPETSLAAWTYTEPEDYNPHAIAPLEAQAIKRMEPGQEGVLGLLAGHDMLIKPVTFDQVHTRGGGLHPNREVWVRNPRKAENSGFVPKNKHR